MGAIKRLSKCTAQGHMQMPRSTAGKAKNKQWEIIFKCLPGQVVLKNQWLQWLRITKKKGKCETGMTQLGNDRRERPADRSRQTIHESERRGERGENKRGTYRQGQS